MADPIRPQGRLDLPAVSGLHAQLVARSGQDITLDLEGVTHFGALCLQTCIAASRDANAAGTRFDIVNMSDQVMAQLTAMGVTPETLMEGAS